jgi:hypothetical protein
MARLGWRTGRWVGAIAAAALRFGAAVADAGSLDLTWTAPTTNADGSPLTDLAGYRIYVGMSFLTCPGQSYFSMASSTSAPSPGQAIGARVSGLAGGVAHSVRVTAVDQSGNESACSLQATGLSKVDVSVSPTTSVSFGSVQVGASADRVFTMQNVGAVPLSGAVSTTGAFSVVSGGNVTLAPGLSQAVVVRFRPTITGNVVANVTFTGGGDTLSRIVTGTGTSVATSTLTVNRIGNGTVTSIPPGIDCGSTCTATFPVGTTVRLTAGAASGWTFSGWNGPCSGGCSVTLNASITLRATFIASTSSTPRIGTLSPASATRGSPGFTMTVNGTNFVPSSVVLWKGSARATTWVNETQLRATIAAADVAVAGTAEVTVLTPGPGGGTSNPVSFVITAPPEIIIDNAPPGVQDPAGGRTFTGRWCPADALNQFGLDSLIACGSGLEKYRWTPTIPAAGTYDVYMWIPTYAGRSMSVPFTVVHAAGTTTRSFNLGSSGGAWVLHGRYSFNPGTGGYVEVRDTNNGLAGADAVRFKPVP